ncbi:MAG: PAS domain-containing protein [Desulfobacteraceae bacterium]|nr:PAS domain-containing protein [Desulfobacteraceae bacterium]
MKKERLKENHQFLAKTISGLTDHIDLFETVQDLSRKIISQFDRKKIFQTFSQIVKEVVAYKYAAIFLFDKTDKSFFEAYNTGIPKNRLIKHLPEEKVITWVMYQGRWTVITDFEDKKATKIYSILPIVGREQSLGFMYIVTDNDESFYNRKFTSILGFVASQTAIALENLRLYDKIKSSQAYLQNMVESISNGIMAIDMEGKVTLINRNTTAILGIKTRQIIGRHYMDFLKGGLKKEVNKIHKEIQSKGYAVESMVSYRPYKEVQITVGITASLLTDQNKETIGTIVVFRNMSASTEIKRLTRLDKMKSEFVSNASHELRTPLSIIKSYTEALLTQVEHEDIETREHFLSVIDSETDHLTGIVSNFLDVSRIESGTYGLDYSQFSLKELVNSVIVRFKAKLTNIDIFTDFKGDTHVLDADEDKIREVLINLIANSVKFSPTGGIVSITVLERDKSVICSISDTGIGIPKDQLPFIFDKFFRVDNSDTYEIEGTGLGLSIVKHIVESHGGSMVAESILGKGSVFTFSLPKKRR